MAPLIKGVSRVRKINKTMFGTQYDTWWSNDALNLILSFFPLQQSNNQRGNGNNLFPQTPSGWNPLNSVNFNEDNNQKGGSRLPVFSNLLK